jgi:hypothetical protein
MPEFYIYTKPRLGPTVLSKHLAHGVVGGFPQYYFETKIKNVC